MPSQTKKQKKFMAAACNNTDFREKIGIPKKVACDFFKADQKETIKNENMKFLAMLNNYKDLK